MTEPLDSLNSRDWSELQAAYGLATDVPEQLAALISEDAARRAAAVEGLYGTVWHQGTVYEATPLAVPYLSVVAREDGVDDRTRAQTALLLGCIASATSFVLPENPGQMHRAAWLRDASEQAPDRDLAEESRAAVVTQAPALLAALAAAPTATAAALLAPLAAVAPTMKGPVSTELHDLEQDKDPLVAAAVRTVRQLSDGSLTEQDLAQLAAVDDETGEYLAAIADWPVNVRGVELVRELAERLVSRRLG